MLWINLCRVTLALLISHAYCTTTRTFTASSTYELSPQNKPKHSPKCREHGGRWGNPKHPLCDSSTTTIRTTSRTSSIITYSTLSPPSGSFTGPTGGGVTTTTTTRRASTSTSSTNSLPPTSSRTTSSTLIVSPSTLTTRTSSRLTFTPTSTRSQTSTTTRLITPTITTTKTTTTTTFSTYSTQPPSSSTTAPICNGNAFLNGNFGGYGDPPGVYGPNLYPWNYWSSPNATTPMFASGYNTPYSVNLSTDASGGYRGVDQTTRMLTGYNYTFSFDYIVVRDVPRPDTTGGQNQLFCLNGFSRFFTLSIPLTPAPKNVWLHASEVVTSYDNSADWKCNLIGYSEAEIHVTNFALNCTGPA